MVGVAQLVRASACGTEGRGFKSRLPPHSINKKPELPDLRTFWFFDVKGQTMQGTTHIAIGFRTGAVVAAHFQVPLYLETGAVLTLACVGSLLPDIDHPGSKISRSVKLFGAPFRLFSHRGLTHSLVAVVALALLMVFLQVQLVHAVAFLAGYVSHLLADSLTKSGIRLWWPLQRRFRLVNKHLTIKTGGVLDWLIGIASLILAVIVLIQFR